MIIVIIHWKIRPSEESRFLRHWQETLTVDERSHFVGEYLCRPLSKEEVSFDCKIFNVPENPSYRSFFNVGIWKDLESFKKAVIDRYVGDGPENLEAFELEGRERMVLAPISWRSGLQMLPESDHFA